MSQVSFEVYAFDGARWCLQQTFGSRQQKDAVDCAQALYGQPHIKGVRVVQESYDPHGGGSSEKTLLTRTKSDEVPKNLNAEVKVPKATAPTPKAAPKPAVVASKQVPGAPGTREAKAAAAAASAPKPQPQAVAQARSLSLRGSQIAGAVAGGSVLAAGGSLVMMQIPSDASLLLALKTAFGANYLIPFTAALFGLGLIGSGLALMGLDAQRTALPNLLYTDKPAEAPPQPAPEPASEPKKASLFPVIELEEDDDEPEPAKASDLDGEALRLMAFFHDCLTALPRDRMKDGRLDAFNWFGCHLFFAGLVDEEGRRRGWDRLVRQRIIATAMAAVLGDPKGAARFAARYEEYLTEPRSLAMFNRGLEASAQRGSGQVEAKDGLRHALDEWNQRGSEARTGGHVCVMFTDIVGSTEFAQLHGDAKQFELVQAHNRVVRTALQEFSGREIKHTGDGIMSAFDDADLAARAALQIQREIAAHRVVNPEIGMSLPIREGSDLFGSTVQLAARACALAEPGQIIAGDGVRTVAQAVSVRFVDLGEHSLKGFKQPVRVHQVVEA
jgi:adenylate cyclase